MTFALVMMQEEISRVGREGKEFKMRFMGHEG